MVRREVDEHLVRSSLKITEPIVAKRQTMKYWLWTGPHQFKALAIILVLTCNAATRGETPLGIGVLGDSYSDEYQFYPPDRSQARNWVEILANSRGLNFGAFSRASLGEPRNQGYTYNWAQSGAETGDMIRAGQHTGLAGQVLKGEVNVVVVLIGGNDFIHALASRNPEEVVDRVLKQAIANLDLATETILQASPNVQVFIATLPDIVELPEFATRLRAGTLSLAAATACSNAVRDFNRHLRWQAVVRRRVSIVDLALAAQLAPRPDPDSVVVAGRRLDRIHPANLMDHVFLADRRHVGTLLQGVLANYVLNALNARLGTHIKPLSVTEILQQSACAKIAYGVTPGRQVEESDPVQRSCDSPGDYLCSTSSGGSLPCRAMNRMRRTRPMR